MAPALVAALLACDYVFGGDEDERLAMQVRDDSTTQRRDVDRSGKAGSLTRAAPGASGPLKDMPAAMSSKMRGDLIALSGMKAAVIDYLLTNGRLPSSNAELGLPAPDRYRGKLLKSAQVLLDGSIEISFDADSGFESGRIRLVADFSYDKAWGVQWLCETPDYLMIGSVVPGCTYGSYGGNIVVRDPGETQ